MEQTINEVLLKIQTKLVAPKNQYNAFGKYKYRSCEDILEALKPLLSEHGASVRITDDVVLVGDRFYVKATASICVGSNCISVSAFAREGLDKKGMDEAQITGAASSYARKYALNGLFLIDDTKDADHDNQPSTPAKVVNTQEGLKAVLKEKVVKEEKTKKDPVALYDTVSKSSIASTPVGGSIAEVEAVVIKVFFNPNAGKSGMSRVLVRDNTGFEFYVKKWGKVDDALVNQDVLLLLVTVSEFNGAKEYLASKIIPVDLSHHAMKPEEIAWEE